MVGTATVEITNCIITENVAGGGGGIVVGYAGKDTSRTFSHEEADVTITNCFISKNTAKDYYYGGGIYVWNGKAVIRNSTIKDNTATGGAYGGYGGGILVRSDSNGNDVYASTVIIESCTITNNRADKSTNNWTSGGGGGIWIGANSSATVTNCTIAGNSADGNGNELRVIANRKQAEVVNSLIWNTETANLITMDDNTTANFTNCAFPEGFTLEGVTPAATVATDWTPTACTDEKIITVDGITHTVYRIEGNTALAALAGKGTSEGTPEKDQLGHTRNTPHSIGAVEKVNAPTLPQASYTIEGTEGTAITPLEITASGLDIVWSMTGTLPTGLTASSTDKTFTISGTPEIGTAKTDAYTYTLKAANTAGTATATINITIKAINPVLDMTGEITKTFTEGVKIDTITITATTGNDRLTWTANSSALPKGLTGSAAADNKSFTISGTPEAGTAKTEAYSYTVSAKNSGGETASATISITVSAVSETAPVLDTSSVNITVNEGNEIEAITITATAGNNLTWTTSGDLPEDLTGKAADDKMSFTISGIPSNRTARIDAYTYKVTAANTAGSASAVITITVNSTGGINDEVSNALESIASTGETMTLEDALTGKLGLTTEQLKTVTSITISDNITDLGDLSTLLPNLEAIDLTSATSLTEVNLKGNSSIKEVTITGNSNVKTLDLTDCSVETLDATGCDELTEVNIAGNTNIQTLSLDECPNIEGFNAEGCENLTNLSLSNKGSEGRRGKLSSLNLTGCKNLKELAFKGNMMKRFHVGDFLLNSLENLSAGDQAVGNVKLTKKFSFIDFFLNLLFNSNVSISSSKLTAVEVIIATASGDKNVKSVTAYDNSGIEIDGDYDSETGEAVFISTPARIEYDYDTGFDSEESMDVAISGEGVEDNSNMTLENSGGGGGGCNSSFASGALLALLGFVIARKKDSEK